MPSIQKGIYVRVAAVKKYIALVFLLASATCYAADPAAGVMTVSVNYGSKTKNAINTSATSENLSGGLVTLPLDIEGGGRWIVSVALVDRSKIEVRILDPSLPVPPQSGQPQEIFHGVFSFKSQEATPVLETSAFNISVTVTVP